MRLLVLGGSGFLGYHAITEALATGADVTVFNRSGRPPVPGVEVITGDRRDDLSGLRGQEWDAVFDTFTDNEPGAPAVRATAELLSGNVRAYGYVSGMSVYAPSGPSRPDESGPVRRAGVEPDTDRLQERSLAKLAGEAAVTELFEGPALFPRVGIMVGPRSTRFSYWPVRIARAAEGRLPRSVLVPGDRHRSVQYSDARDIAAWSIWMLALGRGGTFNTVGPGRPDSLWSVIESCCAAADIDPAELDFVDVTDEDRLRQRLTAVDEEERPPLVPGGPDPAGGDRLLGGAGRRPEVPAGRDDSGGDPGVGEAGRRAGADRLVPALRARADRARHYPVRDAPTERGYWPPRTCSGRSVCRRGRGPSSAHGRRHSGAGNRSAK